MSHYCEDCKHWTDERFERKGEIGECRRRAPIIKGEDDCAHPITTALWSCGEFEPDNGALN